MKCGHPLLCVPLLAGDISISALLSYSLFVGYSCSFLKQPVACHRRLFLPEISLLPPNIPPIEQSGEAAKWAGLGGHYRQPN